MKVLIVEDEVTAGEHLEFLLKSIDTDIQVLTILDSVKSSIAYLSQTNDAELIFMDIHLSDGISFEIFDELKIATPIIFTTAYDQYAMKAFKVNSIDYLLKPINKSELSQAIEQFKSVKLLEKPINNQIENIIASLGLEKKSFKLTYLVQKRDVFLPVKVVDIAYFYIDIGIVKAVTFDNTTFVINEKLEDIELEIDPKYFHRVNRQFILNKNAIIEIKSYFNGKLIVSVNPSFNDRIEISRAKVKIFKEWMNS